MALLKNVESTSQHLTASLLAVLVVGVFADGDDAVRLMRRARPDNHVPLGSEHIMVGSAGHMDAASGTNTSFAMDQSPQACLTWRQTHTLGAGKSWAFGSGGHPRCCPTGTIELQDSTFCQSSNLLTVLKDITASSAPMSPSATFSVSSPGATWHFGGKGCFFYNNKLWFSTNAANLNTDTHASYKSICMGFTAFVNADDPGDCPAGTSFVNDQATCDSVAVRKALGKTKGSPFSHSFTPKTGCFAYNNKVWWSTGNGPATNTNYVPVCQGE